MKLKIKHNVFRRNGNTAKSKIQRCFDELRVSLKRTVKSDSYRYF